MAGKSSTKRRNAVTKRCARLRAEGYSLSEISEATGIPRDKVKARILLGERLISVEEED